MFVGEVFVRSAGLGRPDVASEVGARDVRAQRSVALEEGGAELVVGEAGVDARSSLPIIPISIQIIFPSRTFTLPGWGSAWKKPSSIDNAPSTLSSHIVSVVAHLNENKSSVEAIRPVWLENRMGGSA